MREKTLGYGTTYTTDEAAYEMVSAALDAGYRVINTCTAYGNERGMGKAFAEIPRDKLTIISLDSNENRSDPDAVGFDGYQATMSQIQKTLDNLKVSYVDYYLIHWPVPRYMEKVWRKLNADTWRAMEDCAEQGLIKHLGVSNFLPYHLSELQKSAVHPIEANQLEIHPYFQQRETVEYCKKREMQIMAWSPFFKGKLLKTPPQILLDAARIYGKEPAQIILRWNIQHNILPIISTTDKKRMRSNLDIFDFELSDDIMRKIDSLESGEHVEAYSYQRQKKSLED